MNRRTFLKALTQAATSIATICPATHLIGCQLRDTQRRYPNIENLIDSSSRDFQHLSKAHNSRFHSIFPTIIAQPTSEAELQRIVMWARENPTIPLHLRGGGHCFEDFSSGPGLLVDLQKMNSIEINPKLRTASVGGGARIGPLCETLSAVNMALPLGSCPTVGIAGLTLGGGYGFLSRRYGLTCDALKSIRYVLSNGQIVTADKDTHSDLFWASRGGGGGQFGIATNFEFRLQSLAQVSTVNLIFNASDAKTQVQLFNLWQELNHELSDRSTFILYLAPREINLMGWHIGSTAELRRILQPLLKQPQLTSSNIQSETTANAFARFGGPLRSSLHYAHFKSKSLYFRKPIAQQTIAAFCALVHAGHGVGLIFDPYGGAISKVDPSSTAFVHRNALSSVQIRGDWSPATNGRDVLNRIQELHSILQPSSSGSYVNYCDVDLKDWKQSYWGENLARLESVKKQYDPENIFRHRQSI